MADNQVADEPLNPVHLAAREIAPPSTISDGARRHLSVGAAVPPTERPGPGDVDGWRRAIMASEEMFRPIVDGILAGSTAILSNERIGGVATYIGVPKDHSVGAPVYLYFHGGAFVFGGGRFARAQAAANAERLGCTVVSVDYRMPPDDPFPAAPEDCLAVYAALLERFAPGEIVIGGGSAGGNLAAATILLIRERGLPMPAGLVLLTPEVDLTESGDSFQSNELLDVMLKRGLPECNLLYAGGRDLADPLLSPLFADVAGFPPTFVQAGTRDLFLSNAVLFHRKLRRAGIEAHLHVWEAMPHGGFGGATPEDAEVYEEVGAFIRSVTGTPG
jgi:acetyl esterase/lipase